MRVEKQHSIIRMMSPHHLGNNGEKWLCYAYCDLKEEFNFLACKRKLTRRAGSYITYCCSL